jgi:hypothetical protein
MMSIAKQVANPDNTRIHVTLWIQRKVHKSLSGFSLNIVVIDNG